LGISLYKGLSPLDGRYAEHVAPLTLELSETSLITNRVKIEVLYLIELSNIGVIRTITPTEKRYLVNLIDNLIDGDIQAVKKFEEEVHHDVKAVELFLRNKLEDTSLKDLIEKLHYCLTSEDINNLAYRLMLKDGLNKVVLPSLQDLIINLREFSFSHQDLRMMARTHGQDAVPTTLGKEMMIYAIRLFKIYKKLESYKLTGKLNGAIGGWNAHVMAEPKIDWINFSNKFIKVLDLEPNKFTTQINPYDDVVELLSLLHLMNSIITDMDQDIWRYISDGWLIQKVEKKSVGSSTMAQKVNPINFENSEGNAQIANGLIETLNRTLPISRLQRDLSNSTIIRNIAPILGHTLIAVKSAVKGLEKVSPDKSAIEQDLNANWSVLAEPLQILLRKHNYENSYDIAKSKLMGKKLSESQWKKLIESLDIEPELKKKILTLKLDEYIGYCVEIVENGAKIIKF
jgi:adenylosuccinate lyase